MATVIPALGCPAYVGDTRPANGDASVFSPADAASAGDAATDGGGFSDAGQAGDGSMMDGGASGSVIQCAPFPLTVGMVMSLGSGFYPAFRFEVATTTQIHSVGLAAHNEGAVGTIFAALVKLTGANDYPDSATLSTADVIGTALIGVPAGPNVTVVSSPLSRTLSAGWYAVVFGTGRFGATMSTGYSPCSMSGTTCFSQPGAMMPFTIRNSDGFFQSVAGSPHMFVTTTP